MTHFPKPFFRKSRKTWAVQINGKQINLGRDQEAAFRRYHELMAAPAEQPRVADTSLVVALCDNFLNWVKKHRSPATYEWYRHRLQRFVELYPDLTVAQLKPFHVQEWVDGINVKPTTQRNYIRSVKRAMKWSRQQGYIDTDPIAEMQAPSAERREQTISKDEYLRFLAAIPDEGFRDLVAVSWETGCRPQESLRVEARHFDAEKRMWIFPKSESKTKRKARVVYLTESASNICARLASQNPTGPLFRNSKGKPWTSDAVQCAVRRVRMRLGKEAMIAEEIEISASAIKEKVKSLNRYRGSGVTRRRKTDAEMVCEAKRKLTEQIAIRKAPSFCLYLLRHSFATRALLKGVDSLTVSQLLGHEDVSTLAKVYQHLSSNPEHLLSKVEAISP